MVPGDHLDPLYLYHFLSANTEALNSLGTGTTFKELASSALKGFPIPLPPLDEQQRIVAILDEAFEGLDRARANAGANLQSARELFESALYSAFADENGRWEAKPLSELGSIQTGSTPKTSDAGNKGNYLPFIKPGDFETDGSLVYDNEGLSQRGAGLSRIVPAGSALMVCIGATIGKAGFTDRPVATNQQINAISPITDILGKYLYYQMLTPGFQASVMYRSGQATLPIINKSKWSTLTVRLPLEREQQSRIVEKLATLRGQLDELKAAYDEKTQDMDDLRQSLLQKAFAGELT